MNKGTHKNNIASTALWRVPRRTKLSLLMRSCAAMLKYARKLTVKQRRECFVALGTACINDCGIRYVTDL